uniref:Uncharacterized protein n=1 Tax=Sphaerodactylus townsendi TaxID=933632 RepID=A0ACB8G0T1_9SAUR
MRLLKLTENGDIDRLVEEFIEKEEKNFAYFSYVTELNNDMERLQKRIEDIENEISQLKSQQKKEDDVLHDSMKEVEDKLQKTVEDANVYEYKLKETSKILDHLKSAVGFLFRQTGCDATKIKEHLGETGEITDQNLMQYFSELPSKLGQGRCRHSLKCGRCPGPTATGLLLMRLPCHMPVCLPSAWDSATHAQPSISGDAGADPEETILNAFKVFDPESKGLKANYIKEMLMTQGERFSQEEVEQMFAAFPPDVTGNLDYKNLVHIITHGEEKD